MSHFPLDCHAFLLVLFFFSILIPFDVSRLYSFFFFIPIAQQEEMHFPVSSEKLHKIQDFDSFFFFFFNNEVAKFQACGISVLLSILHIRRFLKKLRSLRVTKKKAVKAVNVYIWISFLCYMSMSPS